jgi:nitrite reductase (NADH) small subunit
MGRVVVCPVVDLAPGQRRVVTVDRRQICVVNSGGHFYAIRDLCPHQGSALSAGTISGTMLPSDPHRLRYGLDGRVIRCPWHAYEFDLETGRSLFDPEGVRVKTYPVSVDNGVLVLDA